jgi:hypothetical protein
MDFIVNLLLSTRNRRVYDAILIIVNRFTKISIYIAYNKIYIVEDLTDLFYEEVIYKYSIPKGIMLDRGSIFTSAY